MPDGCAESAEQVGAFAEAGAGRQRFLLLDARIVEDARNAELALGTIEKHAANPLFGEDRPWEKRFDNLYANVLYDDEEEIYKCWYSPFVVEIGDDDVYRGNYDGQFWYGAVFRAHPSSDKLMRSRLEFLAMALPFGWTLSVHESRLFLQQTGHESRARRYRLVADKYGRKNESMSADRFRNEVVRHMRYIGNYFDRRSRVKRIDGLDWRFMMGGRGFVSDDFGYRISFVDLGEGKFAVSELGPDAKDQKVVDSIHQLREIAKKELTATSTGYAAEDEAPVFVSGTGRTTQIGYVNRNGQRCLGHRARPGNLEGQLAYKVECANCAHVYGANGADMHERRCPNCQGGKPGLPYWDEVTG